jgi:hypothetical protein
VLRRGIIAKYVAVRSHYGIILPQMGQTRDEALERQERIQNKKYFITFTFKKDMSTVTINLPTIS